MDEPLLKLSHGDDIDPAPPSRYSQRALDAFYTCSLVLGLVVGFFVECTALAAHVLLQSNTLMMQDGAASYASSSLSPSRLFTSLVWALATAFVPCAVLVTLKTLLQSLLMLLGHDSTTSRHSRHTTTNTSHDSLVWHLECRFGLGSFGGVSLASLLVDALLQEWHTKALARMIVVLMLIMGVAFCLTTTNRNSRTTAAATQTMAEQTKGGAATQTNTVISFCHADEDAELQALAAALESTKKRKLDSVDPEAMDQAELKPNTLKLV